MFLLAAGKSESAFNRYEATSARFCRIELRPEGLQLVRASLQARMTPFRFLDILQRFVEIVPLATPMACAHVSEQVGGNPVQIEPARHLSPNLRGDVLRAVRRRIDQIPQAQEKTAMVMGWWQRWRNAVLASALPPHAGPLALPPPCLPIQIELAVYRDSLRRTALFPVQTFDRAANARFTDPVRPEYNVETCPCRFDFKRLTDTGQPVYGKSLQSHDGSP